MLLIIIILLCIILIFVTAQWLLLKKEIRQMAERIRSIKGFKTNERITVLYHERSTEELANAVNGLYKDIHEERGSYRQSIDEMRESMANISHDLRTPLTSIIGYIKLLQNKDNTPKQQEHYLDVISGKSKFLNELIENLFILTRLEVGAYKFTLERLNVGDILSEELAGFYDVFTGKGNQPEIEISSKLLWTIGDRLAFSRIFINLLQNMVTHGLEKIHIRAEKEGDKLILCFSNRARQMKQKDVEQLFQRFFTADRMRSGENTGLGLAIVKELVEQLGGSIEASLKEEMLTFVIILKAA